MTYPFGETVTHLDGTVVGLDSDNNDVYTFPVKAVYEGIAVAPQDGNGTSGNERLYQQDQVITGLALYGIPASATVAATDRFIVRGDTWEVSGAPQYYLNPLTGWSPGYVVSLSKVTG